MGLTSKTSVLNLVIIMLDYRSQFSKPFRDIKNRKIPNTWPQEIYKEQLDLWNKLGERARDFNAMSTQEFEFLGLKPVSKSNGEDVVSGIGIWNHILNKKISHGKLKRYLSWQMDSFNSIKKRGIEKAGIKCALGNNINFDDDELEYDNFKKVYYSRFKEDIRDVYTLAELNDRDCKIVHFVQAMWPKEQMELIEAIRLLKTCVENNLYYQSMDKGKVNREIKNKSRTIRDAVGYRYWYFDIDQKVYSIESLKQKLKDLNLYKYLKTIVMTSSGRFHIYFNADLEETAHWDPFSPPSADTKKQRAKYAYLWDEYAKLLSADVGKPLTQKASTPGYRNPRTGEIAAVVHGPRSVKKLNIETAHNLLKGIIGEDIELPVNEIKINRVTTAHTGIPTFQQYNDFHGYGDEIIDEGTLNEKVKKLTTHLHLYVDFPFSQADLDRYFNRVVLQAFKLGESEESLIYAKFMDWVGYAERSALKFGLKQKKYITQDEIDEIDFFLGQFEQSILYAQSQKGLLTPKMELKIPRLIQQIRLALLDPDAKVKFKDGHLIGKIPCKFLKGPENGLGRYNELIKKICEMGLIHRDIRYTRPYKLPDATWAGEARTWRFHLTAMAPQVISEDIWNHSFTDYQYWIEQQEQAIPDWVPDYQRLLAA